MSLVGSLPSEVLLHIASFLEVPELVQCTSVCDQFSSVSRDYTLWKRFFVDIKTKGSPEGRLCHTGVVHDDRMYVFGGHTTQPASEYFHTVRQDMYEYTFATRQWAEVSSDGSKRTEHTTIVYKDSMYVFGGYSGTGYENAVVSYNFKERAWTTLEVKGTVPSARSAHTAIFFGEKMYVFGGWNGQNCMNDLYELDLEKNTWSMIPPQGDVPCARCSHGSVVMADGASGVMYIFGGYSTERAHESPNKGYLNDLYEFHFDTLTWSRAKATGMIPSPRSRFRMVSHKDSIYLFAGWNSQSHFNNLFQYSTRTGIWTEIATNFVGEGIGQFSMVVHNDFIYVFSGFSPSVGSRSNLFVYPLNALNQQAL